MRKFRSSLYSEIFFSGEGEKTSDTIVFFFRSKVKNIGKEGPQKIFFPINPKILKGFASPGYERGCLGHWDSTVVVFLREYLSLAELFLLIHNENVQLSHYDVLVLEKSI